MDVFANNPIYAFADFRLDPARRRLLHHGEAIALHPKAFDLLIALVENRGLVLSKNELLNTVWEGQFIEEGNLAVQIFALRKIFGETKNEHRFIVTVPGKGYRFVADVRELNGEPEDSILESETTSSFSVERENTINENAEILAVPNRSVKNRWKIAFAILLCAALIGVFLMAGFDGRWFYKNQASVNPASQPQMTITRLIDGGKSGAATISPDGKFVAYGENASVGAGTLYAHQIETNTTLQLLEPGNRQVSCVTFSPDGSLIYYKATQTGEPYGAFYSIAVFGGTPKRIMDNFYGCPALSPDGRRVIFFRNNPENNSRSLMIAEIEGKSEQNLLTRTFEELNFGFYLSWLPVGNLIAFNADAEPNDLSSSFTIFGVDAQSGATVPLSTERFYEIGRMNWTSDGQNLIFVAKLPSKENQLYLMNYPSGEIRKITNDLEAYGNSGLGVTADSTALVADIWERTSEIWSINANGDARKAVRIKDGTTNGRLGITALTDNRLAYIARVGDNLDILTVKEDGTQAKSLTLDSFSQKDVAASPDGRYLVFASDKTGESRIFRMTANDGSEITQLTANKTADSQPDVSPDGNWVVYTAWDGRQNTIWKVPMTGGESLKLTDYESISPVFSPDGKTIACVLPSDTRAKSGSIAIISADGGKPTKSFQVMPFTYFPVIRWTPDGKSIVYRNWQQGVHNLWQQPLSGDAPRRLSNFSSGEIWNFAYSRDGKRILLSRGTTSVNIVQIKNFR